jgi:enoyl-CoA hydratase/carnithine racemase
MKLDLVAAQQLEESGNGQDRHVQNAFPHAKLTRSPDGVLEVVLHTDGDTLVFDRNTHEEFVDLFHQIGQDADNRVVILTGAGKAFIDRIDPAGFDFFTPRGYDKN